MYFEELSLPIGKTLTLKLVGQDYKSHEFNVQLMGYQKGKTIAVTIPSKPGQVLLQAGSAVSVSAKLPIGTMNFSASILLVQQTPFLFLLLEYPADIDVERLRQKPRFPIDAAVEVTGHTALGMKTGAMGGYMLDISENGARIVVEKELTAMISKIEISIVLVQQGLKRRLNLLAEMRNKAQLSARYPDCTYAYGVEFIERGATNSLFVGAYCMQETINDNVLQC